VTRGTLPTRRFPWLPVALVLAYALVMWGTGFGTGRETATHRSNAETIYVRNLSPKYISDATIRRDIPAWERAVNHDFAPAWHSAQYRIVLAKSIPAGAIGATFVDKGPVAGALAYHTVTSGAPQIVVYAGTAAYYGYDNSVSFTHELFELAADAPISVTNQGWPYDWIWIQHPDGYSRTEQAEGTVWAQEVCDPVEEQTYAIDGVRISDFVTPNWFNDEVAGPYDEMGAVQQPFTILTGGYAQYLDPTRLADHRELPPRAAGGQRLPARRGSVLGGMSDPLGNVLTRITR
jgi:hypothetical protein